MNQVFKRLPLALLLFSTLITFCLPSQCAQPVAAVDTGVTSNEAPKSPSKNATSKWSINSQSSTLKFHLKNMGLPVNGSFTKISGTVNYDGKRLAEAAVDAKIDVSSIDTGISMRDHHLKTKDFFDVSKFPQAEFVSTKVEAYDNGTFKIFGNLKLHGISQNVALDAEQLKETTDESGNRHLHTNAKGLVSRKHFKIGGISAATIGNDVAIELSMDLVPML